MTKLDIGSGPLHREGYKSVDLLETKDFKPDYKWDLEKGLPPQIKDGSVEKILASHVFEHIHNLIKLIDDCYRVLKNGGQLEIIVPSRYHSDAYGDPTHIRFFDDNSFNEFCVDDSGKLWFSNYLRAYGYKGKFKRVLVEGVNWVRNPYYAQPIPGWYHAILEAVK